MGYVLTRLNQVMHGWASYFRHAVAKNVFDMLDSLACWRVIRMLTERQHWKWKDPAPPQGGGCQLRRAGPNCAR